VRTGVRLALDWGKARIGVAACDRDGLLAYPVETVPAGAGALPRVQALVAEYEPFELILGLPVNLAGVDGPAALAMREIADALVAAVPDVPVRLLDERLTTASASRQLSASGRSAKRQRAVIDQAAAVALLDTALTFERNTGRPAGRAVDAQG